MMYMREVMLWHCLPFQYRLKSTPLIYGCEEMGSFHCSQGVLTFNTACLFLLGLWKDIVYVE
jgi:hypothetical protein